MIPIDIDKDFNEVKEFGVQAHYKFRDIIKKSFLNCNLLKQCYKQELFWTTGTHMCCYSLPYLSSIKISILLEKTYIGRSIHKQSLS